VTNNLIQFDELDGNGMRVDLTNDAGFFPSEGMSGSGDRQAGEYNGGFPLHHDMGGMNGKSHSRLKSLDVKLPTFNGNSCLETFLVKFQNMSQFYLWDEREQLFYLKAHLDGAAGQLLWCLDDRASVHEVIQLLRRRFGNYDQAERYRAELRMRRRAKGETLQTVFNDVSRLMSLAYPRSSREMAEIVGRDAILEALGDARLRIRILEREPTTMDDVLRIATRLEALDLSVSEDTSVRQSGRYSRTVTAADDTVKALESKMDELRKTVDRLSAENSALRNEVSGQRKRAEIQPAASAEQPRPDRGAATKWQNGDGVKAGKWNSSAKGGESWHNKPNRQNDVCRKCKQKGHWARDCTEDSPPGEDSKNRVVGCSLSREVYLKITIAGRSRGALLDTGCEHSCIARKFIPKVALQPTTLTLTAANETNIPVCGQIRLNFAVGNKKTSAVVLVSEHLDEFILGVDWLTEHHCTWKFGQRTLIFEGEEVPLLRRPSKGPVRRVYVKEDRVVGPDSQTLVPVRVTFSNLHTPASDWIVEPKVLAGDTVSGRTVIAQGEYNSVIQVLNLSDKPVKVTRDTLVGEAEPTTDVVSCAIEQGHEPAGWNAHVHDRKTSRRSHQGTTREGYSAH
jgi:predicted aspartyl protease